MTNLHLILVTFFPQVSIYMEYLLLLRPVQSYPWRTATVLCSLGGVVQARKELSEAAGGYSTISII